MIQLYPFEEGVPFGELQEYKTLLKVLPEKLPYQLGNPDWYYQQFPSGLYRRHLMDALGSQLFRSFPYTEAVTNSFYRWREALSLPGFPVLCGCGREIRHMGLSSWRREYYLSVLETPWLVFSHLKPRSQNDIIANYLTFRHACCPMCRIISFFSNPNRDDNKTVTRKHDPKLEYNIAFYTDMTRLAFENALHNAYDGLELWQSDYAITGQKPDFYVEMFWKLYIYTCVLCYSATSTDPVQKNSSLMMSGIGIDWYQFSLPFEEVKIMNETMDLFRDQLQAAFVHVLKAQNYFKKSGPKPLLRERVSKMEDDFVLYDSIITFLEDQENYQAIVLAMGMKEMKFNPWVEIQEYMVARSKPIDKKRRIHVKRELLNKYDKMRHEPDKS